MKRPVLCRPLHAAELWAASVRTLRPARRRRSHVPRPLTSDLSRTRGPTEAPSVPQRGAPASHSWRAPLPWARVCSF